MVVDSSYFLESVAVVDVDEVDAAFLGISFLPGVGCGQELPSVAEFKAANSSNQYLPEISQLILEDMVQSQLVAAAHSNVVAQRMQSQAADKLVGERLNSIAFAIKYFDKFASGLLVVPQSDHIFLFGEGGEDGSMQADVQRIDLPLVKSLV